MQQRSVSIRVELPLLSHGSGINTWIACTSTRLRKKILCLLLVVGSGVLLSFVSINSNLVARSSYKLQEEVLAHEDRASHHP